MTADTPEPRPPESKPSQPTTVTKTFKISLSDIGAVKAITEIPLPEILYHYTTRQGLLGIVTNRELYASNIRYLNDSQELKLPIRLMTRIIEETDLPEHHQNEAFKGSVLSVLRFLTERYDSFVASFSANRDDLSQWRAYSGKTDGYAIGFTSMGLLSVGERQGWALAKCIYKKKEQRERLRSVFRDAHARLIDLINQGKPPKLAMAEAVTLFAGGFFIVAPTIKHRAFRDEEEWRLIHPVASVWDEQVDFRNSGTMLVPYERLDITIKSGEEISLPIAEVVIGPHPHMRLEKRALSGLFTVNHTPHAKITESEIPYRNW